MIWPKDKGELYIEGLSNSYYSAKAKNSKGKRTQVSSDSIEYLD